MRTKFIKDLDSGATQTKKRSELFRSLDAILASHLANINTREAKTDDSSTNKSKQKANIYKVGWHHSRIMKRYTVKTILSDSTSPLGSTTSTADPPVLGTAQPAATIQVEASDSPANATTTDHVVSDTVPPAATTQAGAASKSPANSTPNASGDSVDTPAKGGKNRIKSRNKGINKRPVIIPELIQYASPEKFISNWTHARCHCLHNTKRNATDPIPNGHHSLEIGSSYKHMLDFRLEHPTRVRLKAAIIQMITDNDLMRSRWKKDVHVWPIGNGVRVCRKCFGNLYCLSQSYLSSVMQSVKRGDVSKQHGNKGGLGRDKGQKTKFAEAGVHAALKHRACDYMPHNANIRTDFASNSEMAAEIKKVMLSVINEHEIAASYHMPFLCRCIVLCLHCVLYSAFLRTHQCENPKARVLRNIIT